MSNSGLIVRSSGRFEKSLPARVRVGMMHFESVQFAKGVADADRWIEVGVVDFAEGGVGFVSNIFFARGLSLEMRIDDLQGAEGESLLVCNLKIQRVQMADRRPTYLIGCSFSDVDKVTRSQINSMITRFLGEANTSSDEESNHS